MGIDTNIHIGPYIKLNLKKVTNNNPRRVCDNDQCPKEEYLTDGEKFCPICGDPIRDKDIPETEIYSYYEWVEENIEYEDVLVSTVFSIDDDNPKDILISNSNADPDYGSDIENGGNVDIGLIDMGEEIKEFAKKYKKLIENLTLTFGDSNVSIHWGTLVWFN